jgi:hypothetical protein
VFSEAGEFDLTKLDRPVEFHGRKLELIGSRSGLTKIIFNASENRAPGTLTLSLKAADSVPGSITVRNVWFATRLDPVVAAGGVEMYGVTKPAGLRIEDAAKVDFTDCQFEPADEKLRDHDPRSVVITRDGGCDVSLTRCLFMPAADGIVLPPGSTVKVADSGFGPHAAAFFIEDDSDPSAPRDLPPTAITLGHCSFMLDPRGAVVETGASAKVHVTANDCLFAPVGPGDSPAPNAFTIRPRVFASNANTRGVVIRVKGENTEGIEFDTGVGHANGFYSADPLGTSSRTYTFADCKADDITEIRDTNCETLKQRPWFEADPLAAVAAPNPWKAFKLKVEGPDVDRFVFTKDSKKRDIPLGVAFYNPDDNIRRAYLDLRTAWGSFRPKPAEVRMVWWPVGAPDPLPPGVYSELKTLLRYAKPGETIYIHHTGEQRVDNEEIKAATKPSEGELHLTFKPDDNSHPILVIEGDKDPDQTLFKLKAGEVTFEGLHFRLKPNLPRNAQIIAAVSIIGGKGCTFRNCVFTLAGEDDSHAAVVYMPDPEKFTMMDPASRASVPKIVFDNCLIRGRGRAVWVEVSRPVSLDVRNTITALDGPVVFTRAEGKAPGSATSSAKFTNVTALVGGPIIEMRGDRTADAMRPGGLVKFEVDTDACLFATVPFAGQRLVDIDGVDPADWKNVLSWRVGKGNRYSKFDASSALAVIKPGGDGMIKEWNRMQWVENVNELSEDGKRFGEVEFTKAPAELKDLATVRPADLVVKSVNFADLTDPAALEVGAKLADLQRDLKALLEEVKPE